MTDLAWQILGTGVLCALAILGIIIAVDGLIEQTMRKPR